MQPADDDPGLAWLVRFSVTGTILKVFPSERRGGASSSPRRGMSVQLGTPSGCIVQGLGPGGSGVLRTKHDSGPRWNPPSRSAPRMQFNGHPLQTPRRRGEAGPRMPRATLPPIPHDTRDPTRGRDVIRFVDVPMQSAEAGGVGLGRGGEGRPGGVAARRHHHGKKEPDRWRSWRRGIRPSDHSILYPTNIRPLRVHSPCRSCPCRLPARSGSDRS